MNDRKINLFAPKFCVKGVISDVVRHQKLNVEIDVIKMKIRNELSSNIYFYFWSELVTFE